MDFFIRGFLKGKVYCGKLKTDKLKTAIAQEAARLPAGQGLHQPEGSQAAADGGKCRDAKKLPGAAYAHTNCSSSVLALLL